MQLCKKIFILFFKKAIQNDKFTICILSNQNALISLKSIIFHKKIFRKHLIIIIIGVRSVCSNAGRYLAGTKYRRVNRARFRSGYKSESR